MIDRQGKPILGAASAPPAGGDSGRFAESTTTDVQGRFRWEDAPPDAVWIDILGEGYLSQRNREIPPTENDSAITMIPIVRVKGTVVDSDTGRPIEAFSAGARVRATEWLCDLLESQ